MADPGLATHGAGLSRRRLLGAVGGLAASAGTGAIAGCSAATAKAGSASASASASATATATAKANGVTTTASHGRRFVTEPDLRPLSATVKVDRGKTAPGLILAAPYGNDLAQQGPMIFDNSGELVWFRPLSAHANTNHRPFNFRAQQYQGQPVLTWFEGEVVLGHGRGRYAIADSAYQVRYVEAGNGYTGDLHEFLLTDKGTALFTCVAEAHADLSSLGGSRNGRYFNFVVQELDIATGRVVFQWKSDEHVSFAESYRRPSGNRWWDPYHVNSITVASDGNLILSMRNTWTAYKVDRSTGKILWRLGGKRSDFKVSPEAQFSWQHDITAYPGGRLTVFDNASAGNTQHRKQSRGLLLSVDEDKRTATLIKEYLHNKPRVLSPALGSVQLLPDGHVLVGWGDGPYVTEYHPDGTILYDLDVKNRSYRAFRSVWTGRPSAPPVLAVRKESGGMKLYVSWNGDTEVRHWQVLLGSSLQSMSPVMTVARDGFETTIPVSHQARYIAVAGLADNGKEIGRSGVHSL